MLFTPYWWVSLGYVAWIMYDVHVAKTPERGGRRSEWLRNAGYMKYYRDYFPITLVKTADLDPSKNYILGYHPHGIVPWGAWCNFSSTTTGFEKAYPGIKSHLLTLDANLKVPLVRGYLLWMGCCSVSKDSIKHLVTKQGTGNAAVVVVGGAGEALEARPGNYKLTLKNRKGFIKLAIQTGACLVPVFTFGENELYKQAANPPGSALRLIQDWFKSVTSISPPVFYGRGIFNYSFGIIPFRVPIKTVIGRPIEVSLDPNPPQEIIDKTHQRYMDDLSDLFDEHKASYGLDIKEKLVFT